MPILQFIVILIVTFVILVFVLRKVLHGAGFRESKRLQQLVEENALREQQLGEQIAGAEKLCAEKIAAAEEEAENLKAAAASELSRLRSESIRKAEEDGKRLLEKIRLANEKKAKEIDKVVHAKSVSIAQQLIHEILTSNCQEVVHATLLQEIMTELEELDPKKLPVATDKGEILSPYEIAEDYREQLQSALSRKTGTKLTLPVRIDDELVGGIKVKVGSLVIDGSLGGKLETALRELERRQTG